MTLHKRFVCGCVAGVFGSRTLVSSYGILEGALQPFFPGHHVDNIADIKTVLPDRFTRLLFWQHLNIRKSAHIITLKVCIQEGSVHPLKVCIQEGRVEPLKVCIQGGRVKPLEVFIQEEKV